MELGSPFLKIDTNNEGKDEYCARTLPPNAGWVRKNMSRVPAITLEVCYGPV